MEEGIQAARTKYASERRNSLEHGESEGERTRFLVGTLNLEKLAKGSTMEAINFCNLCRGVDLRF